MKIIEKGKENQVNLIKESAAARYLGISPTTLRKSLRYQGKINFVKWNTTVRYLLSDLDSFIRKNRVTTKK
jgi:NADH/NAD ratio-sensing transcriptional regulator Rex